MHGMWPLSRAIGLSHIKKLTQVHDFGGVGAKKVLTSRNIFLARPNWDPALSRLGDTFDIIKQDD